MEVATMPSAEATKLEVLTPDCGCGCGCSSTTEASRETKKKTVPER
jgi:hypothetical protein